MSIKQMVQFACDRCGEQKYIERGHGPAMENVEVDTKSFHFCDKCIEMFRDFITKFTNQGDKKHGTSTTTSHPTDATKTIDTK